MDFGTLKTRIQAIIGRPPADVCYELVTADINQELRLRVMETETTIAGALEMTLPSDFLSIETVYEDVTPRRPLKQTEPQALQMMTGDGSGRPTHYAIVDGKMLLNQVDGANNIILRYHASLADLALDADTNDVLTKYPSLYVYGALTHHAALRGDDVVGTWVQAYEKAKRQARADDNKKGGPPPQVVARNVA